MALRGTVDSVGRMDGRDLGLLVLRGTVGGVLAAHGAQKLFGWFGGNGLDATAAGFEQIGFRPGRDAALAAGLGEAGGGALLALGAATPLGAAAALGTMRVAAEVHRPQGFFAQQGGFEYPGVLGALAAGLALAGPGQCSFDAVVGRARSRPLLALGAMAGAMLAADAVIRRRREALAADPAPD